ncbi:MAG: GNAT family N-acetyltransferase, partial [Caldilineaceae bacterium]
MTAAAAPGITIRTMRLEDLPKVYALGETLFTAEKWPALYRTWDEYEIIEYFASDGEFCLVAVTETDEEAEDQEAEELVAFCLGTLLEKRHSAWRYGYLVWMGVNPTLKGRGIGRRLLSHLTDLFVENGARMMLVDTAGDNENALRFFRSQGFGHELEHVYLSRNLDKHPK